MIRRSAMAILLLASGAWADTPLLNAPGGSFPAAVITQLEATAEYKELKGLYDAQRSRDEAAGKPSLRAKKILARLNRLRGIAATASTVDPEDPGGRPMVNVLMHGRVRRLVNLPADGVSSPGPQQDYAGVHVADLIVRSAANDGLVPFDLPPAAQATVDAAMARGFEAAKRKDFSAAAKEFETARQAAPKSPDVFYNLGLAESKVPGRELRAACWLAAYVEFDPDAENAGAVRGLINDIKAIEPRRFSKAMQEVVAGIPDLSLRDICMVTIVEQFARLGDYAAAREAMALISGPYNVDSGIGKIGDAQVRRGRFDDAMRTAGMIREAGVRGAVLRSIAEAKHRKGDREGALRVVEGIDDPFCKATAYEHLANMLSDVDDYGAAADYALKGLAVTPGMERGVLRETAHGGLSTSLSKAGKMSEARAAISGLQDPFQIRLATLYMGEYQAKFGDRAGSDATLASMRGSLDAQPDSILENTYREIKARIESGKAGIRENDPAASPYHSPGFWTNLIERELSRPEYLDFKAYVASLPSDRPYKMYEVMKESAARMLETYTLVEKFLE